MSSICLSVSTSVVTTKTTKLKYQHGPFMCECEQIVGSSEKLSPPSLSPYNNTVELSAQGMYSRELYYYISVVLPLEFVLLASAGVWFSLGAGVHSCLV